MRWIRFVRLAPPEPIMIGLPGAAGALLHRELDFAAGVTLALGGGGTSIEESVRIAKVASCTTHKN